ncbi:hypothetical protein [Phreatobacter sp.]|uniref:hypothetical protein n=1 Tax=Phreatobacter sp. TaxID=1966341 RepID=UPI0022BEB8FF|nr:hypothetical protein [Phreatobacter sp.]MCZ8315220.1 hypothetical protein [Phreatobacter sp.]
MSPSPSSALRRPFRIASLVLAGLGVLFWAAAMVATVMTPASRGDGFHMLGAILATIYLVTLVLPGLILALLDRWPPVSLGFGIVAVAIASDAVLPWLPWGAILS